MKSFTNADDYRTGLQGYATEEEISQLIELKDKGLNLSFEAFCQVIGERTDAVISDEDEITDEQEPVKTNKKNGFFLEDGKVDWLGLFQHYDLDGSGFLERDELRSFFKDQGATTDKDLDQQIAEIDVVEQDGKISFAEFVLYHMNKEEK